MLPTRLRDSTLFRLPRNIWVLALCQALTMATTPFMIIVGGLLGTALAPRPELATLPLALIVIGTASASIPAALLMRRIGRKLGTYCGYASALAGLCLCFSACFSGSFAALICGSFFLGINTAFAQQFRFAALESLERIDDFGVALPVLLLSGIVSAFMGPELASLGREWIPCEHGFAGSFVLLGGLVLLAMLVFSAFRNSAAPATLDDAPTRPLGTIVRQPTFLCAVGASAIGYAIMSFIMTATPINMVVLCGFGLDETKRVIQSHIAAMFLPSLASGFLIKACGIGGLVALGSLAYAAALGFAFLGADFHHFWGALVLLGIGWNFLFTGGTALLPRSYRVTERFRAQAANDFLIFGTQAVASLGAGWFLFSFGWSTLLAICIPAVAILAMGSASIRRISAL